MKAFGSQESRDYMALRWCVYVGTVLATLIVLFASFSGGYHWLTRLGSIALILLSTLNLFLVNRSNTQRPQSTNEVSKTTSSISGNESGGAR